MEFEVDAYHEGAKALIRIKGSEDILVMRRGESAPTAAGLVDLPGGKSASGESPFLTITREVQEELGIKLEQDELAGTIQHKAPSGLQLWLFTFVVDRTKAESARPISECSEVIIEPIETYLARTDAWRGFQLQVRYSLKDSASDRLATTSVVEPQSQRRPA